MRANKYIGISLLAGGLFVGCTPLRGHAQQNSQTKTMRGGQHDFDFNIATWHTHIRRILNPLSGSTESYEMDGTVTVRKVWGAYVERGHGKVALFLHGFPLNGFQWRGVLARFSKYRRCIAPDLMGLGYTETNDEVDITPSCVAIVFQSISTFIEPRIGERP